MDCTSRREFLRRLSALGAASMLPSCATMQPASSRPTLIDTHHHFYAPAYQKAWLDWDAERKVPTFQTQREWSPARWWRRWTRPG
jgi:hypothetical protein